MKREHGTIKNYVIGFVLSLVFTLIPYYLAVNQVVKGIALFGTIVGFALVQALIQIVFFLHLGRERKPHWQAGFLIATAGAIVVVTGATTWIMYHLNTNLMPNQQAMQAFDDEGISQVGGQQTCISGTHATRMVMIMNGVASPRHTNAKICDSIMFMNDDVPRNIAFGSLDNPDTYGGQQSLTLGRGQDQTMILNEPGKHSFHDSMHDTMTGDFTVTP